MYAWRQTPPAMAIPQTFIQELIARADVVDIVGRHVQLKKGGANHMGLCPFHGEKSPSFSVSPSKQFYHCFGCGKNGNVIGFLMDYLGMSFVEAVKDLAQQYGMQVPEDDSDPRERARAAAQRQRQLTLTEVLERAGRDFRQQLKASPRAVQYLKGRGLSGAIARDFGLGYAPEGWHHLAGVFADYTDPLLEESGLVIRAADEGGGEERRYDRFRDRIMFPIRNVKGECIGFGGRVLGDGTPKYLNSPETPVFSKGRELYGLFEARAAIRESGFVLVTEGYMDVVALAQLGFPNAVATLGTACTADHVQKIFRFTDAVVFSFDGDSAGRRAARKALEGALPYATDLRSVKFLFLPAEHDPDSFVREFGRDAFAERIAAALPLSRFLVEVAAEDCDLASAEGRARMASQARGLWSALPSGALKAQLLGEIASAVQLGTHELSAIWGQAQRTSPAPRRTPPAAQDEPEDGAMVQEARSHTLGAGRPGTDRRPRGRTAPVSRADHATRLLLSYPACWDELSAEDHGLLCALPAPHGPLFVWLESQLHDHGAMPWGALREGLREHSAEALALQVMADQAPAPADEVAVLKDVRAELRDLLNRMLVEQIKAQETEAIAQAATDPLALARYRALHQRRRELEATLAAAAEGRTTV